MTTKEQAKRYFEQNPNVKVVYGAGSYIFTDKKLATNHAATLENPVVETITTEDVAETEQKVEPSEELPEDFTKVDYNQLKALVTALNLEVLDQKKETLIAAIENYKNNL